MKFVIAQIVGAIALVCTCVSLQQNKKSRVLAFQIFANIFYFLQYYFLGAIAGAAISAIGAFRVYMYYQCNKRKVKPNIIPWFFYCLTFLLGVITYDGLISIIPTITSLMYTYGTWQNNLKRFRKIAVVVATLWFVYNLCVGAYVGLISTTIEFASAAIAIYRLDIRKKKR